MKDGHDTAVSLMRMALALLDRDGRHLVAVRLQHAIDTALDSPVVSHDDVGAIAIIDAHFPPPLRPD